MAHRNPSTEQLRTMLERARTIAVVGYSANPDRPSQRIARALQRFGYRVIPVRPGLAEGLGERAYARLADIPADIAVDIVDVFRASEHVPEVLADVRARGLKQLWLQDGIVHESAAAQAATAGVTVVMDRCISRDYNALIGRPRPPPTVRT